MHGWSSPTGRTTTTIIAAFIAGVHGPIRVRCQLQRLIRLSFDVDQFAGSGHAGIDTHKDLNTAAVIDEQGSVLGVRTFATTRQGYNQLLAWMGELGRPRVVGVEGSGSYGAGVTRRLAREGIRVLEVTAPERTSRRTLGKDDALDAISAARAALEGRRVSVARTRTGEIEALRVLRTTRATAVKARRAALQQLGNTIIAAPEELRDSIRALTRMRRIRTLAAWRPDRTRAAEVDIATRLALRSLARRVIELTDEIADLDALITPQVARLAPALVAARGIGTETAGQLLVTAGDNPERLQSEGGFAMLLRRGTASGLLRQDRAPPSQPRWGPRCKPRTAHDRRRSATDRSAHP